MARPTKGVLIVDGAIVGRVCSRCLDPKPSSAFGPDRRNSTGLQSWCRKCISARQAERVKQDPIERAKQNKRSRDWAKAHRDDIKERNKRGQAQYRAQHPDRIAARGQVAYRYRDKILRLFNRCMACGTDQDLTVDHVISLGQAGATNDPQNLQVLCRSCNSTKGDRTIDYRTDEQQAALALLDVPMSSKRHTV